MNNRRKKIKGDRQSLATSASSLAMVTRKFCLAMASECDDTAAEALSLDRREGFLSMAADWRTAAAIIQAAGQDGVPSWPTEWSEPTR